MTEDSKTKSTTSGVSYLVGPFSRELNYKLWSTKGARFVASNRLNSKATVSLWAVSLMSFYLIIFSIIPFFIDLDDLPVVSREILALINVSLSIFVLMIGQILNRSDYREKSKNYHHCALRLSRLYNALRIAKTMETDEHHAQEVKRITNEYEEILEKYDNHENIDYNMFRAAKRDFPDHKISIFLAFFYRINYYCRTYLFYHALITLPLALIIYIVASAITTGFHKQQ